MAVSPACHATRVWSFAIRGGVEREGIHTAPAGFRSKKLPGPYDFATCLHHAYPLSGVFSAVFPAAIWFADRYFHREDGIEYCQPCQKRSSQ